jgi:hypothetical protein
MARRKQTFSQAEVVTGAVSALVKFEGTVPGERAASFIKEMLGVGDDLSEVLTLAVDALGASEQATHIRWDASSRCFKRRLKAKKRP